MLAAALARRVALAIRARPRLVLGLPTGRTPLALYAELVRVTREEGLDWSQVRTFNLDEFIGLGSPDAGSYRRLMDERFFAHVDVDPTHVGFLDGRATDVDAECKRYERAIAAVGGIDVQLLGIGANGHIGFNEPADALIARTHRAMLDEQTRAANAWWFGGDVDRVPREGLTVGLATILAARSIILVATGESKRSAVTAMIEGRVSPRAPASFLQLHPRVSVLIDEGAS